MIITRTPYRVSFAGGGTDLPAFCDREDGAVFSVTIDSCIYVTVHPRFGTGYRVSGMQTEEVDYLDDMKHDLIRESIRTVGITKPLEITTIGDVPAGAGMGSSGSLVVGLIHAFHISSGQQYSPAVVAKEACDIEINRLGHPVGRQDQYAAAFGGFNFLRFRNNGAVDVVPVNVPSKTVCLLEEQSLLLFTDSIHDSRKILANQSAGINGSMGTLKQMRGIAAKMPDQLCNGDLVGFAESLNEEWELKRSLGCGITTKKIDDWYETALLLGAHGGKLLGAGGGGFFYLIAPSKHHQQIREGLGNPLEIEFRSTRRGSRVVFDG